MPKYKVQIVRKNREPLSDGKELYECEMMASDKLTAEKSAIASFTSELEDRLEDCEFITTEKEIY